jgi:hypothetical protein
MSMWIEADLGDVGRTPRRVDVIQGEGMVTVAREIVVDGQRLRPGVDRFSPDHPWVRQRCEVFIPCMRGDKVTAARMLSMYRAAERELLAAPTRTTATSRGGGLALPDTGPQPLKL